MTIPLIGARIKAARENCGLSQDSLARLLGFKDRQTVSAIETGERRVSAEELIVTMEKLGRPLDYFTDPFLLAGEGTFSWRQSGIEAQRLATYERSVGRWIAAYRTLAPQVGRETPLLRRALDLTRHSSYEDATAAGERFAAQFELGRVPAKRLADVIEQRLGILVLMVDALEGISGAACRLPELDCVLINRHEVAGRRHFDLAHGLFHLLTWEAMPPERVEEAAEVSRNRVEQLANGFASALLMPAERRPPRRLEGCQRKEPAPSHGGSGGRTEGHGFGAEVASRGARKGKSGYRPVDPRSRLAGQGPPRCLRRCPSPVVAPVHGRHEAGHRRGAGFRPPRRRAARHDFDHLEDLFATHGLKVPFEL